MNLNTSDTVRQAVADLLSLKPAGLGVDTEFATFEAWDSVQQLNLVLSLEEIFSIQFAPEEIETLNTVRSIAAAIDARLVARA